MTTDDIVDILIVALEGLLPFAHEDVTDVDDNRQDAIARATRALDIAMRNR